MNIPDMTLRDYFAAKAMQAVLSLVTPRDAGVDIHRRLANLAYEMADQMLKARRAGAGDGQS